MTVTIPVTMTTMPNTQKSPGHDVKSTCGRGGRKCHRRALPCPHPHPRAHPLLTLVWKQKMVTMMATMAVMSMAMRTAFVRYVLRAE